MGILSPECVLLNQIIKANLMASISLNLKMTSFAILMLSIIACGTPSESDIVEYYEPSSVIPIDQLLLPSGFCG